MKRRLLACLFYLQAHRLARFLLRKRILILAYHGFTAERAHPGIENSHGKHLHVDVFRTHLEYLKQHYNVVSLDRVVEHYRTGTPLPNRTVVLTIDDGYESSYRLAFPLLKEFQVPATVFVTTNFVDNREWLWTDRLEYALSHTEAKRLDAHAGDEHFSCDLGPGVKAGTDDRSSDRRAKLACDAALRSRLKMVPQEGRAHIIEQVERCLGQTLLNAPEIPAIYRPLDWDQAREMIASGLVSIGGHTVSHVILTRCDPQRARQELAVSREVIEQRTGTACRLFCYPNGQPGCFDADTEQMLKDLGYTCGITTVFGTNESSANVYELKRLYFDDRGERLRFIMTVTGVVGALDAMKRRLTRLGRQRIDWA